MLKGAGVRLDLGVVPNRQRIGKQTLRQPVPPDHARRAQPPLGGELHAAPIGLQQPDPHHRPHQLLGFPRAEVVRFVVGGALRLHPHMLQDLVEVLVLLEAEHRGLNHAAVLQVDPPVGALPHLFIVGHHQDGVSLFVQLFQNPHDDLFVGRVQVSRGLVGQDDLRLVDQGPRDGHPLLLASRQLRRQMLRPVPQTYLVERPPRFLLVGHAVEVLRHHDVLQRAQVRD